MRIRRFAMTFVMVMSMIVLPANVATAGSGTYSHCGSNCKYHVTRTTWSTFSGQRQITKMKWDGATDDGTCGNSGIERWKSAGDGIFSYSSGLVIVWVGSSSFFANCAIGGYAYQWTGSVTKSYDLEARYDYVHDDVDNPQYTFYTCIKIKVAYGGPVWVSTTGSPC